MSLIQLPIKLYDRGESDLTGKPPEQCNATLCMLFLDPTTIESFQPAFNDEDQEDRSFAESLTCTRIITKSGQEHYIYLNVNELEERLRKQWEWEVVWRHRAENPR